MAEEEQEKRYTIGDRLRVLFDLDSEHEYGDGLLTLTMGIVGIVSATCIARAIIEGFNYKNEKAKSPNTEPLVFGEIWIIVVSVVNVLLLGINGLYMYISKRCRVENRVGLFLQMAVCAVVTGYAEAGEGWGTQFWLLTLPTIGVLLDIPFLLNAIWTVLVIMLQ